MAKRSQQGPRRSTELLRPQPLAPQRAPLPQKAPGLVVGSNHASGGLPLDDVDLRLLALLHDDARMSVRALGRAVGMSAGASVSRSIQQHWGWLSRY